MAHATLQRPARPPGGVSAPTISIRVRSRRLERRGQVNPWVMRYACLAASVLAAVVLVGMCALVSEFEAVRWKLSTAVDAQRAEAMRLIRDINAHVNPAEVAEIVAKHHLTTNPAGVITAVVDVPLPPVRPTPVTTPQPLAVGQSSGVQVVEAYHAGVK